MKTPLLLVLLGLSACAASQPTVSTTTPAPQSAVQPQVAQAIIASTAIRQPMRVVFSWAYHDEAMRFSGKGALRVDTAYRARTDLFGPRGETLMRSVVVGDSLFVPPGLPEGLVPPVSLSWAALGVLRPDPGARLELTAQSGDTLTLGYAKGQEHWRYRLVNGHMRYAEWIGAGSSKRSIELRGTSSHGIAAEAVYRDWAAFRELTTTVEEVHESASFPPDTWDIYSR